MGVQISLLFLGFLPLCFSTSWHRWGLLCLVAGDRQSRNHPLMSLIELGADRQVLFFAIVPSLGAPRALHYMGLRKFLTCHGPRCDPVEGVATMPRGCRTGRCPSAFAIMSLADSGGRLLVLPRVTVNPSQGWDELWGFHLAGTLLGQEFPIPWPSPSAHEDCMRERIRQV